MNIAELTTQTRDIVEQALNRLQVATLLSSELETQLLETGRTIQLLSQIVENFSIEQSGNNPESASSNQPDP
jgi:hypothetical protein